MPLETLVVSRGCPCPPEVRRRLPNRVFSRGMLRRAAAIDSFLAKPFGAYVVLPSFLVWYEGKRRNGVSVFGDFDESAVEEFFSILAMDVHPEAEPHVSIVDFRGVTHTTLSAMTAFLDTLKDRLRAFARTVEKRIILFPSGTVGIAFAGLRPQVAPAYPVRLALDLDPHLEWLGIAPDEPILGWLRTLSAELGAHAEVLRGLRAAFAGGATTLEECAKVAGISARSLQRMLAESGASFRDERLRFRMETAKALLSQPNKLTIGQIAARCGFASSPHFATSFRASVGKSPAQYRDAFRGSTTESTNGTRRGRTGA